MEENSSLCNSFKYIYRVNVRKNGLRMLRKQENCITYLSITLVSVQVISIDQTFSFLFPNQPVLLGISAASRDGHTYNVVCGKVYAGKLDQSTINFLSLGQTNIRVLSFPRRLAAHARVLTQEVLVSG